MVAQPQQPSQHVRDVAAEDAAVHVRLVDDDVAQLLEELEPLGVMGQDRRVEHVRVGDDDLPGGADVVPDRIGRVAVVDARGDIDVSGVGELAEGRQLVLAERLGREQVQRAGGGSSATD